MTPNTKPAFGSTNDSSVDGNFMYLPILHMRSFKTAHMETRFMNPLAEMTTMYWNESWLHEMVGCHSIFVKAKVLSGWQIVFCSLNWVDDFALLWVTFSKSGALSVVLLVRWGQIWPNLQQSLNWLILTISYYASLLKYQVSWTQLSSVV